MADRPQGKFNAGLPEEEKSSKAPAFVVIVILGIVGAVLWAWLTP
ncbi:MAG TPA: hypothetical protein PLD99_02550 [Parcubacteria group bacterium]|nr:hypothetical protein [Parcubacteria group bacterium]